MVDWEFFLNRLRAYPACFHRVLPPCPDQRIVVVEQELGQLPKALRTMLERFNGAELFISAGASFTLFGISATPPLSPSEWAPDWYIDKLTPLWRSAGSDRQRDWAIAMANYGGLILLAEDDTIKEWDTGQRIWLSRNLPLGDWIEKLISEGDMIMAETR